MLTHGLLKLFLWETLPSRNDSGEHNEVHCHKTDTIYALENVSIEPYIYLNMSSLNEECPNRSQKCMSKSYTESEREKVYFYEANKDCKEWFGYKMLMIINRFDYT